MGGRGTESVSGGVEGGVSGSWGLGGVSEIEIGQGRGGSVGYLTVRDLIGAWVPVWMAVFGRKRWFLGALLSFPCSINL